VLTDTKIEDWASLREALTILHETYSVPNVIISSIPMEPWLRDITPSHIRSPVSDQGQSLLCLASVRTPHADNDNASPTRARRRLSTVYAGCVPLILGYFSGVGDLFSALVLGHYNHNKSSPLDEDSDGSASQSQSQSPLPASPLPPIPWAVSLALTKTHAVLRLSDRHASSLPPDERETDDELDAKDPERRVRRMRGRELRLIQGQRILTGEAMGELRLLREWEDFWGPS
jgi:pyridoxine kinase